MLLTIADGDYFAQVTVTTLDGRSTPRGRDVRVRTHDVAINKLIVPQAARAGQTRQIIIHVTSKRYDEDVEVYLSKSTAQGLQQISTLRQPVPVQPGNRSVAFSFSYTFTSDDARIGKVIFAVIAVVHSNFGIDALDTDNFAFSPPIKVSGAQVRSREEVQQDQTVFLPIVEH